MRTADINGASLAYDMAGEGRPLIFVHGFLAEATGSYYARFKQMLAETHRAYFLDMRAHGATAAPGETATLAQGARDIVSFADFFGLADAVLVGHSMGGYLCRAAAALAPGRFGALALVTPAGSKGQPGDDAAVAAFMAARQDAALMDQFFAGMFVAPPTQEVLANCRAAALRMPDDVAERWMRTEWPDSDSRALLGELRLPTLSLIGAKDVVVPPLQQYQDAVAVPGAKAVLFEDAGHMLPLEQPARCMREITRFLDDAG